MRFIKITLFAIIISTLFAFSNVDPGDNPIIVFNLVIPDSSLAIINECKAKAITFRILKDELKVKVPATIIFKEDTFHVKIRLKGDYSDHWSGEKVSYRVYMSDGETLLGMSSFSLQNPQTRRFLSEWYFHKLLEKEGLIALRNKYVDLNINHVLSGSYHMEESFNDELLAYNNREKNIILKFDESILINSRKINKEGIFDQNDLYYFAKVDLFDTKDKLNQPKYLKAFQLSKQLLDDLRLGKINLEDAIDIEKAAIGFAISDVVSGLHSHRWKNVRFYYDDETQKLEVIFFDSNSGFKIQTPYYQEWITRSISPLEVAPWKDIFFENDLFVAAYLKHLKRISADGYLEGFHQEISGELNGHLNHLKIDFPDAELIPLENYLANIDVIKKYLDKEKKRETYFPLNEYFFEAQFMTPASKKKITVQITNKLNNHHLLHYAGLFQITSDEKKLLSNNFVSIMLDTSYLYSTEKLLITLPIALSIKQLKSDREGTNFIYKKLYFGITNREQDTLFIPIEVYRD